ncbi:MAG: 5'/3'-nucleotidase SurE [candidate division Zixibacteria bacterium]|nr:5'/3'-nucleotidase SurE [candidate division Zixibacteria bacterium]
MLILLTNDDGIHAEGMLAAQKELKKIGQVLMVAPDREQSASSHSLTLERPLRLKKVGDESYTCDGTPTDCVMMAIHGIMEHRMPDLIVSGINHGANMAEDVTYSGTVAAAIEGSTMGIPSMAVSNTDAENMKSYKTAAQFTARLAKRFKELNLPSRTFLNINFPKLKDSSIPEYKFTSLGQRTYKDIIIKKTDPRGKDYYWIAGEAVWESVNGTDYKAISDGFISISALKMNFTDTETIKKLADLELKL